MGVTPLTYPVQHKRLNMSEILAKCFLNFFSIPIFGMLIIVALFEYSMFPPTPRFRSIADCRIYAADKAHDVCKNLSDEADTEYFDYDRCYSENYHLFFKAASKKYKNPPELSESFLSKLLFRTKSGFFVLLWLVIGSQCVLYRIYKKEKWYWFDQG